MSFFFSPHVQYIYEEAQEHFNLKCYPCFFFYKGGKKWDTLVGARKVELERKVAANKPKLSEPEVTLSKNNG